METRVTEASTSRHAALGLSNQDVLAMYRLIVTARQCDEAQFRLNRQGKAPFVVPVSGHEGCQVASAWAFDGAKDAFLPYYRDLAVCLTLGFTARDVFLGVFGKRDDPSSAGRQMPSHWGSRRLRIVTHSSPIATQLPHASGMAYAFVYRGEDGVVGSWFGEGATSEGDWHEALNFAGIHRLPVVFFCENNQYAISVPQSRQMAVPNVADRAAAYGLEGAIADGNDVLACYEVSRRAVDRARRGEGPTLVEFKTYRFRPHTSDDDDRTYRSREEVEEHRRHDPLLEFGGYLKRAGLLTDEGTERIAQEVRAEVERAIDEAWNEADPDPSSFTSQVYAPAPEAGR